MSKDVCAVAGCRSTRKDVYEEDGRTPLNFFYFRKSCHETINGWLRVCDPDTTLDNCGKRVICSKHFLSSEIIGNRILRANLVSGAVPTRNVKNPKYMDITCQGEEEDTIKIVDVFSVADGTGKLQGTTDNLVEGTGNEGTGTLRSGVHVKVDEIYICQNIHPIRTINDLLPSWYYETAPNGDTWYFHTFISNSSPPKITRSVKVSFNGGNSAPQFYTDHGLLLSKRKSEMILKNARYNTEPGFVSILEKFVACVITCRHPSESVLRTLSSIVRKGVHDVEDSDEEDVPEMSEDKRLFLDFIAEQVKLFSAEPQARRFAPAVSKWALEMQLRSPDGYKYLCNSGCLILPCNRTLRRYTFSDDSKPTEDGKRRK